MYKYFASLGKFIPKYFTLFYVNEIVLIPFQLFTVHIDKSNWFFYVDFVSRNFAEFIEEV